MTSAEKTINYNELLKEVLTKEGSISECYSNFHNFSLLNSLLAMIQMKHMGLPITPIACGSKWRELGRTIKDHRKIELCMPVFFTVKDANGKEVLDDNGQPKKRMYYKYAQNWYCLAQTEGETFNLDDLNNKYKKEFSFKKMLNKLCIIIKDFDMTDGNCQGYATVIDNRIAINPMAEHGAMTVIHEVAHTLLHKRSHELSTEVKELEAECTAYIVGKMLNVSEKELEHSRGYIQNWFKGNVIPQESAERIIKTADKIYKAGLIENKGK